MVSSVLGPRWVYEALFVLRVVWRRAPTIFSEPSDFFFIIFLFSLGLVSWVFLTGWIYPSLVLS